MSSASPPRSERQIVFLPRHANLPPLPEDPPVDFDVTFYPDSALAIASPATGVYRRMTLTEANEREDPTSSPWQAPLYTTTDTKEQFRALDWGTCSHAYINPRDVSDVMHCILGPFRQVRWWTNLVTRVDLVWHCPVSTFKRLMMGVWRAWERFKLRRNARLAFAMSTHPRLGEGAIINMLGVDDFQLICELL